MNFSTLNTDLLNNKVVLKTNSPPGEHQVQLYFAYFKIGQKPGIHLRRVFNFHFTTKIRQ